MTYLDQHWHQKGLDAFREAFDVHAELKREMVQFLIDEGYWSNEDGKLKWESAVARFNSCLNPNKHEKFSTSELWALALRFDRPQMFLMIIEDLGFERPRRKSTEERRIELLEQIAEATKALKGVIESSEANYNRLSQGEVKHLDPSIKEGRAHFSLPDTSSKGF